MEESKTKKRKCERLLTAWKVANLCRDRQFGEFMSRYNFQLSKDGPVEYKKRAEVISYHIYLGKNCIKRKEKNVAIMFTQPCDAECTSQLRRFAESI